MRFPGVLCTILLSVAVCGSASIESYLDAWSSLVIEAGASGVDLGLDLDVVVNPDTSRVSAN